MQTIGFDRGSKGTFIEHGADEDGLFISLRVGIQGMTEAEARAVAPVVKLRFAQPADLLDFADTSLDLAAAGYRAVEERHLANGTEALRKQWPLAKATSAPKRWQCAKGCGILPDRPEGSGPYLMGADCSECGSVAIPAPS